MTRAEYVYLVLNEIYGTEAVQSQDISSNQDTVTQDCKLNSKIADTLKLTPTSNQYHSACLQYALQNTDKGVPEELYKAVVMAYEKNIISAETRWDEAITKTDAIEILISTMQAYYKENGYPYNNADKGSTVSLEADAKALWEKQDKNDMSCTEEEFIEDYIAHMSDGLPEERFIDGIPMRYSITVAKELEEVNKSSEEQEEDTTEPTEEQDEQKENDEQQSQENNSTSSDNGNSSSGNNNSNNNTSYEEPVYTPPVDNSGSSSNYVEPVQPPAPQEPVYQEPVYTPPVDNSNSGGGWLTPSDKPSNELSGDFDTTWGH